MVQITNFHGLSEFGSIGKEVKKYAYLCYTFQING
jgi:hypothetical protein